MKRMIAIVLAVLMLALALTACGSRTKSTVSESSNGTITDNTANRQDESKDNAVTDRTMPSQTQKNNAANDGGFVNDMMDAAENAGDAITDAGRAVGDAITGNNDVSGAGMTGGR